MLKTVGLSFVAAFVFYLVAAFLGGWFLSVFSSNRHDRSMEAAMTGAFVFGPIAAVIAFVVAFMLLRSRV